MLCFCFLQDRLAQCVIKRFLSAYRSGETDQALNIVDSIEDATRWDEWAYQDIVAYQAGEGDVEAAFTTIAETIADPYEFVVAPNVSLDCFRRTE